MGGLHRCLSLARGRTGSSIKVSLWTRMELESMILMTFQRGKTVREVLVEKITTGAPHRSTLDFLGWCFGLGHGSTVLRLRTVIFL